MSVFIAFISVSLALITAKSGGAIRPVVTFTPNWGNILQSDSVTLSCHVTSTKPEEPRTYEWHKNNQLIHKKNQQHLEIKSAGVEDSGDYQCRVNGGDLSDPVTLNVTNSFVILQRPPSDIYEGDPLTLRCHHIKEYAAHPATFYKDNKEIKSESTAEFHVNKVDLNTAGLYKCTKKVAPPVQPSTFHEHSDEFSVSVKELFSTPKIKMTANRVMEGGDMTAVCDTTRHPLRTSTELRFAFHRDGRPVQEFSESDTYRVPSAQPGDSGNYTCEVRTATDTVRKMSDGFYLQITQGYLKLNIIRMVLSACILAAAVCFSYFHNKWWRKGRTPNKL